MYPLPIEPYLIELLVATDAESFPVVVAGGLGIYLKHREVRHQIELQGRRSLLDPLPLPDARATTDIDAFLSIDIFLREPESGVRRFRGLLNRLGYRAYERARYFQFIKPMSDASERMVKIDLHARSPHESELPDLKVELDGVRLSRRGNAARRTVDAWNTPEAFAINHGVQVLPLAGVDVAGDLHRCELRIPHPFASLCMKIAAASDHERTPISERDPQKNGEKHAADVYLLTAMLSPDEQEESRRFIEQFGQAPELGKIRTAVSEFFGGPDRSGCRTIRSQYEGPIDLPNFSAAILELFAPEHTA